MIEPGYYWVIYNGEYEIAKCTGTMWYIAGILGQNIAIDKIICKVEIPLKEERLKYLPNGDIIYNETDNINE